MPVTMDFRYVIADVFTDKPLTGNQLAVFTDARLVPEHLLQPIAREMNFSETVFVYPAAQGGNARIRIFTPFNELPFAGHPVLGSAFVLAGPMQLPTIVLETGIGLVPVVLQREGAKIIFGWTFSTPGRSPTNSRICSDTWGPIGQAGVVRVKVTKTSGPSISTS